MRFVLELALSPHSVSTTRVSQRSLFRRVMPMRKLFILLLLAGLALPATGQSNYGIISGFVTDSQHLPVAGVVIQLTAASTGAVRHVTTNQLGLFEASALLPDDYELKTDAAGF